MSVDVGVYVWGRGCRLCVDVGMRGGGVCVCRGRCVCRCRVCV